MKKVFLILLLLGLINTAYAADCGGAIQCDCGDTLTQNQVMWYDIRGCNDTGIIMGNDSLILDCNGHAIQGDHNNDAKGIYTHSNDYVRIKNCNVSGFEYGIYAGMGTNTSILDNNIVDNENGVWLQYSFASHLQGNDIASNDANGILVSQSENEYDHSYLHENLISHNGYGARLYEVDNHEFFQNDILENGRGVQIDDGRWNWFYENTFADNAVFNALELAGVTMTLWNSSMSGNSWDDFETNPGYPDYYEIEGNGTGIDYLPIVTYPLPDPINSYVTATNESAPGLVTCPAGDGSEFEYLVVSVRDSNNDPIPGIAAEDFEFEVTSDGDYFGNLTFTFNAADEMTDANGEIRFSLISDTSLVGDAEISVAVRDVLLEDTGVVFAKSYDLNLDGFVTLPDLGIFASYYNTVAWEADYNWDGQVSLPDLGMFAAHYQHSWMNAKTGELPKGFLNKF